MGREETGKYLLQVSDWGDPSSNTYFAVKTEIPFSWNNFHYFLSLQRRILGGNRSMDHWIVQLLKNIYKKFGNSFQLVHIVRKQQFQANIITRTRNVRINKNSHYISPGFNKQGTIQQHMWDSFWCSRNTWTRYFYPGKAEAFLYNQFHSGWKVKQLLDEFDGGLFGLVLSKIDLKVQKM